MSELVRCETQNGVTQIILNSPPANAMSPELMRQLDETVSAIEVDGKTRAVVLCSALPKILMAGADLKYMTSLNESRFRQYIRVAQDTLNRLEILPVPTIAAITGHALGGGCELTLCCDFRFMADSKALIGLPEVTLGVLPGAGGTQRLPRLIGRAKATELLIRGNSLAGPEALAIGLVDRLYPPESVLSEALAFAAELAQGATQAIGRIKQCLKAASLASIKTGLNEELEGISYLFSHTQDTKEGITAFVEKRKPVYTGK